MTHNLREGHGGDSWASPAVAPAWHVLPVERVVALLGTDAGTGLSGVEADGRLALVGRNELDERPPPPEWLVFFRQFANTMVVALLLAAVVTVVIGDLKDTVVIVAVVMLNAGVGYVQEHRAEQAMAALRRLAAPFARVRRDGSVRSIPASHLVPGDVIILEAGDVVPADGRLIDAPNLRVNEATLTGEAVPADKSTDPIGIESEGPLADRFDMVYKGTSVTYGRGVAVITATGMQTALGQIAGLLEAHRAPVTPLQQRLAQLGRQIALATVVVCAVVFALGIAAGEPTTRMLLASSAWPSLRSPNRCRQWSRSPWPWVPNAWPAITQSSGPCPPSRPSVQ